VVSAPPPLREDASLRVRSHWPDETRYDQNELISLPAELPLLRTLQKELSQPTMSKGTRMRLVIDKQPEGTKSPNLADAVVMAYWPVDLRAVHRQTLCPQQQDTGNGQTARCGEMRILRRGGLRMR
jgi:hypothetical protein